MWRARLLLSICGSLIGISTGIIAVIGDPELRLIVGCVTRLAVIPLLEVALRALSRTITRAILAGWSGPVPSISYWHVRGLVYGMYILSALPGMLAQTHPDVELRSSANIALVLSLPPLVELGVRLIRAQTERAVLAALAGAGGAAPAHRAGSVPAAGPRPPARDPRGGAPPA